MGAATARREAPAAQAPVTKEWAVYVFMKPDAALEAAAVADIEEMKRATSNDQVHVVVQLERVNDVERLSIEGGQETQIRPEGRVYAPKDSLFRFVEWANESYPASRRMLVIWGHSRGVGIDLTGPRPGAEALGLRSSGRMARRSSPSGPPADGLKLSEVEHATKPLAKPGRGARLDILGFDACYMSSLEYACELASQADYLVAAQGYMRRSGWDYRAVLNVLAGAKTASPLQLADCIVEQASTLEGNTNLSRIELSAIGPPESGIVGAFGRLVGALERVIEDPIEARALRIVLKQASYLQVRQFLDLRDLCHKLREGFDDPVGEAASAVLVEYERLVKSRATGTALGVLNGLSIYCPLFSAGPAIGDASPDVDAVVDRLEYGSLDFVKQTGWQLLCDRLDERTS
jgi:hypothetical protein